MNGAPLPYFEYSFAVGTGTGALVGVAIGDDGPTTASLS